MKTCTPKDDRGRFAKKPCPTCNQTVCVCRGKRGRFKNCEPDRFCFRTKSALAKSFIDANPQIVESTACERDDTGAAFDAINHRQSRNGWRKVKDCKQAVKAVIPSRGPFCYDSIDLKLLNQISAAGRGRFFRLPPSAVDRAGEEAAREHYSAAREAAANDVPFDVPAGDASDYREGFEGARRR